MKISRVVGTKLIFVTVAAFLLASCAPSPTQLDLQGSHEFKRSETYEFPDFGYSIDYPTGWFVDTQPPLTVISELHEDHQRALRGAVFSVSGYQVTLDHRDISFMRSIGLPNNPTLDDLLDLNADFFAWQEPISPQNMIVFESEAYSVETQDGRNWGVSVMGFREGEAFLLSFVAPTENARDAFLPRWAQMLESIRQEGGNNSSAIYCSLEPTRVPRELLAIVYSEAGWEARIEAPAFRWQSNAKLSFIRI